VNAVVENNPNFARDQPGHIEDLKKVIGEGLEIGIRPKKPLAAKSPKGLKSITTESR